MFQVITMGSATIDAFLDTEAELIDIHTKDSDEELIAYPLGTKIPVKDLRYDVGGNGVNVGVGLSRLGVKTGYIGKVGEDLNGQEIMKRLEEEGIEFLGARGPQSGFSVILDSHIRHDRTILGFKGCNNDLRDDEIDFSRIQADWVYLTSMLKDSLETMKRVSEHAYHNDIKIAFNPSSSLTCQGMDRVRDIIEKTDLLILNDEEAEDLVGKGTTEEKLVRLNHLVKGTVVITLGSEGLLAVEGESLYRAKSTISQDKVKENTGAGDAFSSGFLSGMVEDKSMEDRIRLGMLNAESVLQHYGAHNRLLREEEIEEMLSSDEREIEKR